MYSQTDFSADKHTHELPQCNTEMDYLKHLEIKEKNTFQQDFCHLQYDSSFYNFRNCVQSLHYSENLNFHL
jgi:hypothetical protein